MINEKRKFSLFNMPKKGKRTRDPSPEVAAATPLLPVPFPALDTESEDEDEGYAAAAMRLHHTPIRAEVPQAMEVPGSPQVTGGEDRVMEFLSWQSKMRRISVGMKEMQVIRTRNALRTLA